MGDNGSRGWLEQIVLETFSNFNDSTILFNQQPFWGFLLDRGFHSATKRVLRRTVPRLSRLDVALPMAPSH